jgi:hypothetical protein
MYTRVGGGPAGAVAQSRLTEESIPHPPGLLRVRSLTVIATSAAVWAFILIPFTIVWAIGIVDIVRRPLSPAHGGGDPARPGGYRRATGRSSTVHQRLPGE